MITPIKNNNLLPQIHTKENRRLNSNDAVEEKREPFDSVSISDSPCEEASFQRELVSRIVQEIKTRHTSGDIKRIKEAAHSGTYQPDVSKIAARLMLEGFDYD